MQIRQLCPAINYDKLFAGTCLQPPSGFNHHINVIIHPNPHLISSATEKANPPCTNGLSIVIPLRRCFPPLKVHKFANLLPYFQGVVNAERCVFW
jgi:hypothetical protein